MKRLLYSALLISLSLIPCLWTAKVPTGPTDAATVRTESVIDITPAGADMVLLDPDVTCDKHMLIPVTTECDSAFLIGIPQPTEQGEQYGQMEQR
jgi:hypothetical protein